MFFEIRCFRILAHKIHEPVIDGGERLVVSPIERNMERYLRIDCPAAENRLILCNEIRQYGNACPIGHQLLDRLELRRAEHDIRRKPMLRATVKNGTILERVWLLHDEFFLTQPLEWNDLEIVQWMLQR